MFTLLKGLCLFFLNNAQMGKFAGIFSKDVLKSLK